MKKSMIMMMLGMLTMGAVSFAENYDDEIIDYDNDFYITQVSDDSGKGLSIWEENSKNLRGGSFKGDIINFN